MKSEDLQIQKQSATLRAQVEERIRNAIAHGVFKPGQRLVERELRELIGVGRTSVREALRQLEAEGLVTVYPHRGPVVSTLSVEEAQHLYSVRALLEGYAGRMFAERRTRQEIAQLDDAYKVLEAAALAGQQKALVDAKNDFYGVLLEGSGNPYLKQMLTIIHNRVNLLRATSMTQPGRLEKSLQEIRAICDAIRAGDGKGAEAACIAHIEAAAQVVRHVIKDREDEEERASGRASRAATSAAA